MSRRSRSQMVGRMKNEFRRSWDFNIKKDLYLRIKYEIGMEELEDDVSENKKWENISSSELKYKF